MTKKRLFEKIAAEIGVASGISSIFFSPSFSFWVPFARRHPGASLRTWMPMLQEKHGGVGGDVRNGGLNGEDG